MLFHKTVSQVMVLDVTRPWGKGEGITFILKEKRKLYLKSKLIAYFTLCPGAMQTHANLKDLGAPEKEQEKNNKQQNNYCCNRF